jgi:hypothetical protein
VPNAARTRSSAAAAGSPADMPSIRWPLRERAHARAWPLITVASAVGAHQPPMVPPPRVIGPLVRGTIGPLPWRPWAVRIASSLRVNRPFGVSSHR